MAMDSDTSKEHAKFYHPFSPYPIQLDLMRCVYDTLQDNNKKIAILESPTGTGKTLSLICSTVTWLRDHKKDLLLKDENSSNDSGSNNRDNSDSEEEPDWVIESYNNNKLNDKFDLLNKYESHLNDIESKHTREKTLMAKNNSSNSINMGRKRQKLMKHHVNITIEDDEFIPKPYNENNNNSLEVDSKIKLSNEINTLLNKIDHSYNKFNKQNENSLFNNMHTNPIKIIFASRTHSQLNQFASQLSLPHFKSSFLPDVPIERIKFVPLGSKKILCINDKVRKWSTLEAINDACYDLRHNTKGGCEFYQTKDWDTNEKKFLFKDTVNSKVSDIEDLVKIGEDLKICPYYASRDSIDNIEIISLPYQYLLSEPNRKALNLDLKNNIVIIDEAHNLIDTINSIHSTTITTSDLTLIQIGLKNYLNKFKLKLNPGNRVNLLKLLKLISIIANFISNNFKKIGQEINSNDFFINTNADILNIHKLIKYIKISKVAYKIDTYIRSLEESTEDNTHPKKSSSQPLLFKIVSFLNCLTNPANEGQFFFENKNTIKYMLLDPSKVFEPIMKDAKCVIMAGGTMEPVSDFNDNLFPDYNKDQLVKFSCNHIVPDKNINTFIINENNLEFTFNNRNNLNLINVSLYQFITKLSTNVPISGGIVVFCPSYNFLQNIIKVWKQNNLFDQLNKVRKIFYESKDGADPLDNYSKIIQDKNPGEGAFLFAVVGGKLSEGINFQDDLCRAVVMVGLPFPNLASGELQIKKRHLEERIMKSNSGEDPKVATKNFFENICMKAVNQSVGRAIRHINDYASIYLFDNRYDRPDIKNKLSHWVKNRIEPQRYVDDVMKQTREFFENVKK